MSNGITTASGVEVEQRSKRVGKGTLEDKRDRKRGMMEESRGGIEGSTWSKANVEKFASTVLNFDSTHNQFIEVGFFMTAANLHSVILQIQGHLKKNP